jgi:hypothetical protein
MRYASYLTSVRWLRLFLILAGGVCVLSIGMTLPLLF